jgi:3-(3-hydroxy-phenyl)propionate hydroxylase
MSPLRRDWPVIVVGAGPTGLTLASLLVRYGIEVLVIERDDTTVQEPRAVSIDDEALRTMQAAGVINDILPDVVLGYGSHYYSPLGKCFLRVQPATLEYGYPRRSAFRQPLLQARLRDHLTTQAGACLWFNCELVGMDQRDDKILLQVRGANGLVDQVSCSYLAACDGSKSFVRRTLGIDMSGSTFRERWLIIDLEHTNDPTRDTKVFCHPARPAISLPGPHGTRRFEFMLHDHEAEADALDSDNIARWLRLYGNDDTSPLVRKTVYTFHARVAERWSDGRVFLAGDAAHLSPPFAGQGMNSGIRDAHNLAWKLAFVLQGRLGPELLETYAPERRPHAWEMIRLAVRMGYVMMPRNWMAALAMDAGFRLLSFFPAVRDYFAQMKYKPKPKFRQGFLVRSNHDLIGRLFPQPVVRTDCGEMLLDEFLGKGFALLALPGTPPESLAQLPNDLLGPLDVRTVLILAPGDSTGAIPTGFDVAIDFDNQISKLLGPQPAGFLLLRPDRYVAAFLAADELARAAAGVEELMAGTWRVEGGRAAP